MKTVIVIFNIFVFFFYKAHAFEGFLLEEKHSRSFITISQNDNNYYLSKFEQEKGDYPDLVARVFFKNKEDTFQYIKRNYSSYRYINNLNKWSIDFLRDKGLFGKKNETIWEVKNNWSLEWEKKYSEWIIQNVDINFFKKYNIATDCADVAVALRWIFARINYLPQANSISETNDLFGHFSLRKKWKRLKTSNNWFEDELFLTALNYILNQTSTQTVGHDSYPINLDKKSIIPGVFHLHSGNHSGHVKVILETYFDSVTNFPIYTAASTMPREIRPLAREIFNDTSWPYIHSDHELDAFMSFRWPIRNGNIWILEKKENHPNYSLIQFDQNLQANYPSFIEYLIKSLSPNIEINNIINEAVEDIKYFIKQRITIVNEGFDYCKTSPCELNTAAYDNYSTPSRDEKLIKKFLNIESMIRQVSEINNRPELIDEWEAVLNKEKLIIEGHEVTLKQIYYLFSNHLTSSAPKVSKLKRWGLEDDQYILNLLQNIKNNLIIRDEKINRSKALDLTNCIPKNSCFIEFNTYHTDNDLKNDYIKYLNYCHINQFSFCNKKNESFLRSPIVLNNEYKPLNDWLNFIPFLNSDPRSNISDKWGKSSLNKRQLLIGPYDNFQNSLDQLAVIDYSKLIDLKTNSTLFTASKNERLFIEKKGNIFLINDETKEIYSITIKENITTLQKILDPDGLLSLPLKKEISPIYNGDYLIFKITLEDTFLLFRLTDKIEYIDEFKKSFLQNNSLITLIRDENNLSFIDLEKTKVFNYKNIDHSLIPELKYLNYISYHYPYVYFQYNDQQRSLYYPIKFNLNENTLEKLNFNKGNNVFLKFINSNDNQFVIETEHFSDRPALHFIDNNQFEFNIGSQLISIKTIEDVDYFIIGFEIPWESNYFTKIIKWKFNDHPTVINSMANHFTLFVNQNAYSTYNFEGNSLSLQTETENSTLFGLTDKLEKFNLSLNTKKTTSLWFNTFYGDYTYYGACFKDYFESTIPNYTFNKWLNFNSSDDIRWIEKFNQAKVYSGNLTTIEKNFSIWFD